MTYGLSRKIFEKTNEEKPCEKFGAVLLFACRGRLQTNPSNTCRDAFPWGAQKKTDGASPYPAVIFPLTKT
jgi:hypothetical protein